jgi:hypothetical protein
VLQKRLAQAGFAKQTGKGAAATAPEYVVGLAGGSLFTTEISENDLDTTWTNRVLQGHDRESVVPGLDGELVAMPKSLGVLLLGALGAPATTGVGPYTHAYTPTSDLPWLTIFSTYASTKQAVVDAKIDKIEFSWEKTGALKCAVTVLGCTITFDSTWTGGTTEQVANGVLKGNGGTFQIDGASARVTGGSITIENALEPIVASYSVTPDEIAEGAVAITTSLTVVPDDLAMFRSVLTGSAGGTAVQADSHYGALSVGFLGAAGAALDVDASHVRFLTEMPEVDPSGGAAEITLEGAVADPGDGTDPFTVTLTNDVATY